MGASFLWRPASYGKSLGVDARSHVAQVLDRMFGSEPWTLHQGEWLMALRASEPNESAWLEIQDALETHDSIVVWREF